MKPIYWVVCAAAAVVGCSVNSSNPTTAWGKKDVSMINYRTDGAECAVLAATTNTGENGANTAGGISGSNSSVPQQRPTGGSTAGAGTGAVAGGTGGGAQPIGGGTYRDSGSADLATRAAMQQQSQEMAANRLRNERLKSCLVSRGYTEFNLTAEQRAKLATLPQGSDERREYLYKLGTDPEVLEKQALVKKSEPAASASN